MLCSLSSSLLTAIGGVIFRGPAARALTLSEGQAAFPPQIAKDMIGVLDAARNYAGLFGLIGLVSLLWTGSNLFTAIEVSFSRIFGVPRRGLIFQRIVAFFMILVFAMVLVLSMAISNIAVLVTNALGGHSGSPQGWPVFPYLGMIGGWIFSTLMLLVIYCVIPNSRLPLRACGPARFWPVHRSRSPRWRFPSMSDTSQDSTASETPSASRRAR